MNHSEQEFEQLKQDVITALHDYHDLLNTLTFEEYRDVRSYYRFLQKRSDMVDKELLLSSFRYKI